MDILDNIKSKIDNRSNWLLGIVLLRVLDGIAFASTKIFVAIVSIFIAYRLWQRNQFWRNITAYIAIPLSLLIGFVLLETDLYGGIGMIIECIIYIVLFTKCWNEFTYVEVEDPKATKLWRNIVIGLIIVIIFIVLLWVITR